MPYLRYHRLIPEGVIRSHNHIDHTAGVANLLLTYPALKIRSHFDKKIIFHAIEVFIGNGRNYILKYYDQ